MRRLRIVGVVFAVGIGLLGLAGGLWAWRASRRPPGVPAEAACRLGAYRLPSGRLFAVRQREEDSLRVVFLDGFSPAVAPEAASGAYRSLATAESGAPSLVARFAPCGEGTVSLAIDGGPTQTARRVPLEEREVTFESRGTELVGKLLLPPGAGPVPIAVLVHGSERDSAILGDQWQYLLPASGIGAFVYDKRGTGRSGGKYTQDFDLLAADAVAASARARQLAGGRAGEMGYLGGSQGGWIGPLAALRGGAQFVVALYGLAESPLAEDREEVLLGLREAGFTDEATLAKARELTAATGRVMASRFQSGFDELAAIERKYGDEPWFEKVDGEFSGDLLRYPAAVLRQVGPRFDVGTSWDYEPMRTLERLDVPQLWVLAGDDHEAPSTTTLALLRGLQPRRPKLDVALFPHADHGMLVKQLAPDGSVRAWRYAEGYQTLVLDWIRSKSVRALPGVEIHEGGG